MSRGLVKGRVLFTRVKRLVANVANFGESCLQDLVKDVKERDYFEELSIDGRIILKWVLKKWD